WWTTSVDRCARKLSGLACDLRAGGKLAEESSLAEIPLLIYRGLDSEFNHHKLSTTSLRDSLHRNAGSIRGNVTARWPAGVGGAWARGPGQEVVKAGPERPKVAPGPSPALPSTSWYELQ